MKACMAFSALERGVLEWTVLAATAMCFDAENKLNRNPPWKYTQVKIITTLQYSILEKMFELKSITRFQLKLESAKPWKDVAEVAPNHPVPFFLKSKRSKFFSAISLLSWKKLISYRPRFRKRGFCSTKRDAVGTTGIQEMHNDNGYSATRESVQGRT